MNIRLSKIKKPFIIAELSAIHNGKINKIYKLIDKAKKNGASAIKIQSYTPHSMTIESKNKHFYINKGPWKGNYLFDLYKKVRIINMQSSVAKLFSFSISIVFFWFFDKHTSISSLTLKFSVKLVNLIKSIVLIFFLFFANSAIFFSSFFK